MPELRVTLETVTPLFLGGGDPDQGPPEWRPPSFRGALRFWWRALAGATKAWSDWRSLQTREAEVFGSTKKASPVVVRLRPGRPRVVPFKIDRDNRPGIGYLFWSMEARKGGRDVRRAYLQTRQAQLILQTRPGADPHGRAFREVAAALWLLTHLGGLGARARRGGGGLQVVQVSEADGLNGLPEFPIRATSLGALRDELTVGLRQICQSVGMPSTASLRQPRFSVLHPDWCDVILLTDERWVGWEQALDQFGRAFQEFRQRKPATDYRAVKDFVVHGTPPREVQRVSFGLPLPFFYSSHFRELRDQGESGRDAARKSRATIAPAGRGHDRRASPLLIRFLKLPDNRYVAALTHFRTEFLPRGEKVRIRTSESRPVDLHAPSPGLVKSFLAHLEREFQSERVVLP